MLTSEEKAILSKLGTASSLLGKDGCSMAMYSAYRSLEQHSGSLGSDNSKTSPFVVRTITWNMGENRLSEKEWGRALQNDWQIILDQQYDILLLCLQEDWNGPMGKFGNAVQTLIGFGYNVYQVSSRGPPDATGKHFAVKLFAFCKKGRFPNLVATEGAVKSESMCLTKKLGVFCSKATVGLSLMVDRNVQLIAMASHLPIRTDQPSLGYTERVWAVRESLDGVYTKLVDRKVKNLVAFWAGDMNFRANTPSDEQGGIVADQLAYAMSKGIFKGFTEVGKVTFPPTCKLQTCKKDSCPRCRAKSGEEHSSSCYQTETAHGPRPESYCDRILVYNEGYNVAVKTISYKSCSSAKEVQNSDHNLVYANVVVSIGEMPLERP